MRRQVTGGEDRAMGPEQRGRLTARGPHWGCRCAVKRDWGPWRYNGRTRVLYLKCGSGTYQIGVGEVQTQEAADMWLRQLSAKSWTTDADVAGLWAALLDLAPAFKAYRQDRRRAAVAAKSLNT